MPTTKRFGLERKIIANMTSAGWRHTPHVCFVYEAEATRLLEVLQEINAGRGDAGAITVNTLMLKIVTEGIKACPQMNGHLHYSELFVHGHVTTFEQIDVTMPAMLDAHTMMTLNIRGLERKSLSEIQDAVADTIRRARNTNLQQALYEVALHDTLTELKHLRIARALGRLSGFFLLEGGAKTLLHGAQKRAYRAIPATERLTRKDLEQGTIMITNPGSLYRQWDRLGVMMEIIPPQIAAVGINPVREKPVLRKDGTVGAGKTVSLTVAYDHRALDADDLVGFVERVDEIISAPEVLKEWI